MIGHAAAAEWLRTLPWWDWRGWSDWFYGGQAIGVNYPPLGHTWMRFTHPVHGQMAAVAIGLLVLLPWGVLRLARGVGLAPPAQRAAVACVIVLISASGQMHWMLSGFHVNSTFFGSWPAMVATVLGIHAAAWAARCRGPVACGAVLGLALLFNATIVPGVMVTCGVLLATSGASFGRATRWATTAGAAAIAVSAWWLVPFAAGRDRLVRWEVPLSASWSFGDVWQAAVLATVGVVTAWAARCGTRQSRRLAGAALAGLGATLMADLLGYLRPERWLEISILVAAMAPAVILADRGHTSIQRVRPAWIVLASAFLVVLAVVTVRLELLPLAVWPLLRRPRRTWAWSGALAWSAVLLLAPIWIQLGDSTEPDSQNSPLEAVVAQSAPDSEGAVFLDSLYLKPSGTVGQCEWNDPWRSTLSTEGRIRPLVGLYRETGALAEFVDAGTDLRSGAFKASGGTRPHWFVTWEEQGSPRLETLAAAEALGARWFVSCDADGRYVVTDLPATMAEGVAVIPLPGEEPWHEAAVEWWVSLASGASRVMPSDDKTHAVPILKRGSDSYPSDQAASGVSLRGAQDRLTITAEAAGWAWLRVPWDPGWRSLNDTPVLKGGPGHLVVWLDPGTTELRWSVPGDVDTAAAGATGLALLVTAGMSVINRRRGFPTDLGRPLPASSAVSAFADTVDGWVHTFVRNARRVITRSDRV